MLLISGEEVKQALTMEDSLSAVEQAYRELGLSRAVNRPRTDTWAAAGDGQHAYLLKSMDGVVPGLQVSAVRVNSNVLTWRSYAGGVIKAGAGSEYVGLVVLFNMQDGRPLAVFPDEHAQAMRVGATTGLALKYLAKPEISSAAVLGSGRQAVTAIQALYCTRLPGEVKVYSPNPEHRVALAARFSDQGKNVFPVASAEEAVEGADAVLIATSSVSPVAKVDWVAPGRFIGCVKYAEVGDDVRLKSGFVAVNAHEGSPLNYLPGRTMFAAHDPLEELGILENLAGRGPQETDWTAYPELAGVMGTGKGPAPGQSVLFINNIGLGIQFAAIGSALYYQALQKGLGKEIQF